MRLCTECPALSSAHQSVFCALPAPYPPYPPTHPAGVAGGGAAQTSAALCVPLDEDYEETKNPFGWRANAPGRFRATPIFEPTDEEFKDFRKCYERAEQLCRSVAQTSGSAAFSHTTALRLALSRMLRLSRACFIPVECG